MKRFMPTAGLALLLVVSACAVRRPISEIRADPDRYRDKSTRIGGTVTRSYGVWRYGAYELEDASGTIWVIARRGAPAEGSRVEVQGRARSAFTLPFINFTGTVFQEEDRKSIGRF